MRHTRPLWASAIFHLPSWGQGEVTIEGTSSSHPLQALGSTWASDVTQDCRKGTQTHRHTHTQTHTHTHSDTRLQQELGKTKAFFQMAL